MSVPSEASLCHKDDDSPVARAGPRLTSEMLSHLLKWRLLYHLVTTWHHISRRHWLQGFMIGERVKLGPQSN